MAGLNDLIDALRQRVVDSGFRLDDRSDEQLLSNLEDYVRLIPFDSTHSWADFFFQGAKSPETLADLAAKPAEADGTLLPQQAFLLAFLQIMKTPRALLNYLALAHRELYYRDLLGLQEASAQPDSAVLSFATAPGVPECFLPKGMLFDGGTVDGFRLNYALDDALLVNASSWTDLRWVRPNGSSSPISVVAYDAQESAWPSQGLRLFDPAAPNQQPVMQGRLIASSALAMSSGIRTFSLTFNGDLSAQNVTVAQVSGEGGWLPLTYSPPAPARPPARGGRKATTVSLDWVLPGDQPAIVAPDGLDGITMDVPVLRLACTNGLTVPEITALKVTVAGSASVAYSTDSGVSRIDGVSYPFGTAPLVGNGFNLMAAEWCMQDVAIDVTVEPRWIGLPSVGFPSWYQGYDASVVPADNADFKVTALQVSGSGSEALSYLVGSTESSDPQSLFAAGTGAPAGSALKVTVPPLWPSAQSAPADPTDWPRWIRFELTGRDFGYQDYLKLAGTASLNPPYTPQFGGLNVQFSLDASSAMDQYVLTPFGYLKDATQLENPAKTYLYVGLTNGMPGETLSLYWQLQSPQPLLPAWDYLATGDTWKPLEDTLVDGTQGLLDAGLWTAVLPSDASTLSAWMPAGRYWLRATTSPSGAESDYAWLQGIAANAMTATLHAPEDVPVGHFMRRLPAGSITRPLQPVAGLAPVTQPWPSEGGAPPETPAQFFSRTAQRLSHRGRALTWEDMRALLTARFDDVFDVLIPSIDSVTSFPAPTVQTLLVIPRNDRKDNQDRLRPQFSQAHLNEMKEYLQSLASVWATIATVNPSYRDVKIAYDVEFNVNPDYGYRQLQKGLSVEYMPWIAGLQRGVSPGRTLDFYAIVAWIQEQPYVVQINEMTLDGKTVSVQAASNEVLILSWSDSTSESAAMASLHEEE